MELDRSLMILDPIGQFEFMRKLMFAPPYIKHAMLGLRIVAHKRMPPRWAVIITEHGGKLKMVISPPNNPDPRYAEKLMERIP